MLKNKIILFFGVVLMLATSCKDEDLAPIATFDAAEKGAYPALISEGEKDINLNDIGSSSYTYTIEFIDLEKGALVSEYALQVTYKDNDTSDGDASAGPVEFKSWPSSSFETNSNGNKGISNITVTASEALAAFGLSEIGPGDTFRFTGRVTTSSGQSFTASNSSAAVNGAAFRGHFNYTLTAICPSDIGGTYNVVSTGSSTDPCCPDEVTVETTVTLTDNGKGNYSISDWSGGLYFDWYDVYGMTADGSSGIMIDVCDKLSLGTDTEPYGETLTGSGTHDPATGVLTFEWSNGWGDGGTSVYTPQ